MGEKVSGRDFALGIVVGVVAALVIGAVIFATVLRMSDVYSLGHWKLNLRTPLSSMWMNLGYWCVQQAISGGERTWLNNVSQENNRWQTCRTF